MYDSTSSTTHSHPTSHTQHNTAQHSTTQRTAQRLRRTNKQAHTHTHHGVVRTHDAVLLRPSTASRALPLQFRSFVVATVVVVVRRSSFAVRRSPFVVRSPKSPNSQRSVVVDHRHHTPHTTHHATPHNTTQHNATAGQRLRQATRSRSRLCGVFLRRLRGMCGMHWR